MLPRSEANFTSPRITKTSNVGFQEKKARSVLEAWICCHPDIYADDIK